MKIKTTIYNGKLYLCREDVVKWLNKNKDNMIKSNSIDSVETFRFIIDSLSKEEEG